MYFKLVVKYYYINNKYVFNIVLFVYFNLFFLVIGVFFSSYNFYLFTVYYVLLYLYIHNLFVLEILDALMSRSMNLDADI